MSVRTFSAGALLLAAVFSIRAQGVAGRPTPLNDLIAEAEKSNTEILAAEHTWRAATHLRQQVTTLPNPQFSLQELSVGSPKPFAGFNTSNFAYFGIGASQELPYPGKLRLKGEAADRAADVQQAQITVARASVADDIKAAYLKLAYLQETLPLLDTSRNTLGQIIETELARYRIGRGSQADVLKAQLERTKLVREITMHHEEVAQVEADLKRLVHRTQESPDIVAQVLAMTNLQYTSVQLLNLVRTQNPELKLETSRIGKQNAELRSAERSGKPDFSIGYMYQRTGDDFPAYYMLAFNVILQRRERVRAELAEANESIKAAEEQFDWQLQHQLAEIQKQYAAAISTAEMLTEYSVLASFNEIVALKREYEQTLLDHELAVAKLETLTGETLR